MVDNNQESDLGEERKIKDSELVCMSKERELVGLERTP